MQSPENKDTQSGVSRRGFLKAAIVGGAAVSMSPKLALAEQMMTGRTPSIETIRGAGVAPGLVRMNLNENPIGPSPMAIKAITEHMFNINRYGSQEGPLIRALAAFDEVTLPTRDEAMKAMMEQMGRFAGERKLTREEMGQMMAMAQSMGMDIGLSGPYMLTASSSQALGLLTMAYFSREGGEIIEAEFGYGDLSQSVEGYKRTFGVETKAIKAPMTKGYKHDLEGMLSAITPNTKMIVITNPNNPTGTLLSYEEIEQFVNKVPENIIVVVDEAYIHFADGDRLPSAIPLATSRENVVVARTFSKIYAMPALRLGYVVASKTVKQEMQKFAAGGQLGLNMLGNVAGAAAVQDLDHLQRSRQACMDFKTRCYAEFDKMGLEYVPTQSNFMMVNLGREAMPIVMEMGKRKVNVSMRRNEEFKNWMRVSSGTNDETEVFLKTLHEVMTAI